MLKDNSTVNKFKKNAEILNKFKKNTEIQNKRIIIVNEDKKECTLDEALKLAYEKNLDLVEFDAKEELSICKLLNYDDFIYHSLKKEKVKAKTTSSKKIISMNNNIANFDLLRKIRQINKFLDDKHSVEIKIKYPRRRLKFRSGNSNAYDRLIENNLELETTKNKDIYIVVNKKKNYVK